MNKKNEAADNKLEVKKTSSFKIFLLGLHMFIQLSTTQSSQLPMKMGMSFHGLQLVLKDLKVQESLLHMQLK